MKKTIKLALASLLLVPALALGVSAIVPEAVSAVSLSDGISATEGDGVPTNLEDDVITTVVNVLLWIIGIISVVMLIIGGIRYAVSGGDSGAVSSAKNTILYAIIGLAIAIFAYAIVNWVLGELL